MYFPITSEKHTFTTKQKRVNWDAASVYEKWQNAPKRFKPNAVQWFNLTVTH